MSSADADCLVAWEREQVRGQLQAMERELALWLDEGDTFGLQNYEALPERSVP